MQIIFLQPKSAASSDGTRYGIFLSLSALTAPITPHYLVVEQILTSDFDHQWVKPATPRLLQGG